MDDRYTVDTPENIAFAYDIAGIGSRFLAALIDSVLIAIAEAIVFLIIGLISSQLALDDLTAGASSVLAGLATLLGFIILWGYYIIFEMVWNGQSPGKRLIGLRVVRNGGRPITFASSAIRNLVRLVDFLPTFYGIGVVSMFIDQRARRLGDFAAGTLVVREQRDVSLASLTAAVGAPIPTTIDGSQQPTLQNIEMVTEQDMSLVQEFLRRRDELSKDARARLGVQLASGLQHRLGLPTGGDAERFLQYVSTEYQLYRHQLGSSTAS